MLRKVLLSILIGTILLNWGPIVNAAWDEPSYTKLTVLDLHTFNEYRYRITDKYFNLRNKFEIDGTINSKISGEILDLAREGYNYLPDNLSNKNLYNKLKTSIERGKKFPDNESNYTAIVVAIQSYLEKADIQKIQWKIETVTKEWNAPFSATLRWRVSDPSGTKIESYNYVWWIDVAWKRKIIWKKPSINYIFKEEWNFSVFLDVISSHKNTKWYTDVLPFRSRADIKVKEKIASVIIKVNSDRLRQKDELKFTPDEARFGLLFDATSSTPASGGKFTNTSWDFWNGLERENSWDPKVERVIYAKEGEYTVILKLRTNENRTAERKFIVSIHDPIATIKSSQEDWFLWDKFTFSAKPSWNDDDLSYSWEIVDIENDSIIFRKTGSLFTYSFKDKWKYNVKLRVTEPSWEEDIDTQIIHINSQAPVADFKNSKPFPHKPNTVLLDATKSYDPDFSDDWKLQFSWIINGERRVLDRPNFNGSIWYYTFDSIWDQSVVLEVVDPDKIPSQKTEKVRVDSILSVDLFAFPRVTTRENTIRFVAQSPEARFYEWDFGDGEKKWSKEAEISHKYKKSWVFTVKIKVIDKEDRENTFQKNVYIWESNSPFAFINIQNWVSQEVAYKQWVCNGVWAYIVDRVNITRFSWEESIDITGKTSWISYSWKLWRDQYFSSRDFPQKFDELGCVPLKLTVKSDQNWRTHSRTVWLKVENIKPTLSSVNVQITDESTDPVIVKVSALWSKDLDGVIQSYLWYYYTDIDSEPQDFRATKSSATTFVLPKITWNYYFVVVMKDNNEARVTSEEVTGSKYFVTLAWDNINTPLVKLSVNDSSVSIWDEVVFTAKVENILGHDLSKKVEYSWDLDGDGFYEKKGSQATITHKFEISWELHPKVKVKYKGFSSTKNLTVNVSNILKPDFWYISIWNKFIIFDKSIWKYDTIQWNLGDETKVTDKNVFTHTYDDGKASHMVELKISDGTKVKTIQIKVTKNVKNIIEAKKKGLVLFSSSDISSDDELILKKASEKVFIYLGESNPDISNYIADFDIENDSDLNWGKDDDEDNKSDASFRSWDAVEIKLNTNKHQKVRLTIKDNSWSLVESYDFMIVKEYIVEEEIDLSSLSFDWVTDAELLKIEKLKSYISDLPKGDKLKALMYVQKLQEEWFDDTEKTRVILEFEWYIYEIDANNAEEIVNVLESLLIEWEEDRSERNITFNALKNLIPTNIKCGDLGEATPETDSNTCYTGLIEKLETIKINNNIDENREIAKGILNVIWEDTSMTAKQKTDFKAILTTLVYGWVDNIPEPVKQVIQGPWDEEWSDLLWLLKWILLVILYIILGFIWIIFAYWVYYKLINKDDNVWFQDFIIEKTSWKKIQDPEPMDDSLDILSDLSTDKAWDEAEEWMKWSEEEWEEEQIWVSQVETKPTEAKIVEHKQEQKVEAPKWDVPDWLKGSVSDDDFKKEVTQMKTKITETKWVEQKQDQKIEVTKWGVPDWLKWSFTEDDTIKDIKKKDEIIKTDEKIKTTQVETKVVETKSVEQKQEQKVEPAKWDVPDWLRGSFTEDDKSKDIKKKNINKGNQPKNREENKGEKTIVTPKKENVWTDEKLKILSNDDLDKITKIDEDDNIPDWLKGSFDEEKKQNEIPAVDKKQEKITVVSKEIERKPEKKVDVKEKTLKKEEKKELKKDELKKDIPKKTEQKKSGTPQITVKKDITKWVEEKGNIKSEKAVIAQSKTIVKKEETVKKTQMTKNIKEEALQEKSIKEVKPKPKQEKVKEEKSKLTPEKKGEAKPEQTTPVLKKEEEKKTETKKELLNKKGTEKKNGELWDDGMKIPDWLKTEDDK